MQRQTYAGILSSLCSYELTVEGLESSRYRTFTKTPERLTWKAQIENRKSIDICVYTNETDIVIVHFFVIKVV